MKERKRRFNLYDDSIHCHDMYEYEKKVNMWFMVAFSWITSVIAIAILVFWATSHIYKSYTYNDTITVTVKSRKVDIPDGKDIDKTDPSPSNDVKYITTVIYGDKEYDFDGKTFYNFAKKHKSIPVDVVWTFERGKRPALTFIDIHEEE